MNLVTGYSPDRRTALVLSGTGAHGVYLTGVLRALQEAGVKIDLVAGHGIGASVAALAAIDGGARLWDADGVWRASGIGRLYGWRWPLRVSAWVGLALVVTLLAPLSILAVGLLVYVAGFLLEMLSIESGRSLVAGYASWLEVAFASANLPTILPRLVTIVLIVLLGVLAIGGALAGRTLGTRRAERRWWWRVAGTPLEAEVARDRVASAVWDLIRGAAPIPRPPRSVLGRRYAEVLTENLNQPGFRELLVVATDLDARRDVVGALLGEGYRRSFLGPRPGRERRSEVLDLAGPARDHALDVVAAAATPPVLCDPELVTFSPESFWRGETHRLCDRPGAIGRLLEEVAEAGATQAIVVSAVAPADTPHRLRAPRLDVRGRFGEFQNAAESAALRDALEAMAPRFESIYVIRPGHNPIGPFDLRGTYDEASDRRQELSEVMDRASEDAYRQFIEPVIGASGDQLARAHAVSMLEAEQETEPEAADEFRLR